MGSDVIHLHWISWSIGPSSLSHWLRAGRHVFWTLHDLWPLTGGCHYPTGCEQWRTTCLKCPQLKGDASLVTNAFTEKQAAWGADAPGSLTIISPSTWLARQAEASAMFRGRPVHVVRNPIELDLFAPRPDRDELRRAFGIAPHDLLLLFGSYDLAETRKGVKLLVEAVHHVCADGSLTAALLPGARVHLGLLGRSPIEHLPPGVLPLQFGNIEDDNVLADVLAIADVVCVPSLEDNYPNVVVEAMACGTPVIAYAAGGIPEMVGDGVTGLLVDEVGSIPALAQALRRFARQHLGSQQMRANCRAQVERENDPVHIGHQLRGLYEAALGRPITPIDPQIFARFVATQSNAPIPRDAPPSSTFVTFPLNLTILAQSQADERRSIENVVLEPLPAPAGTHLLAVRTFHEHHSARSGPYQFLRHLSGTSVRHMAVPLGDDLAGPQSSSLRRAGTLMGTRAFGQQGNAWQAEGDLLAMASRERFDLMHFIDGELGGWIAPSVPASMFAGGRRPGMVASFHQPPSSLQGLVNTRMLARLDAIIALCGPQADHLSSLVGPGKVSVVPHGVDTSFFRPPATRERERGAPLRLLLVGHWLRDIPLVISVLRRVLEAGLDATLDIISPRVPPMPSDPRIRRLSGLSDEALRDAYAEADLLLLPLVDATANNAILEAMACGLPVVSTAVGGVAEMVGRDAALLRPAGDEEGIARAVLDLAADPARRRAMGSAGRARAEVLDWTVIARLHEDIYARLTGAGA